MIRAFISYSSVDIDFVNHLADAIKQQGIEIWLDNENLRVGDSLVQNISGGLSDADFIIVVLSTNSISSEWVKRELEIGINREIAEKRMLVLPVLYENVEIPAFLSGRIYADFRNDTNFATSITLLIQAMSSSEAFHRERRTNSGKAIPETAPLTHQYTSPFDEKYTFDNYIAYPGNILSRSACLSLVNPELATNNVFIEGGVGIGKSHLAHAIGNLRQASGGRVGYCHTERFDHGFDEALKNESLNEYRDYFLSLDLLAIDDVQFFLWKDRATAFFVDIYHKYCDKGIGIVLTADRPLEEIHAELKVRDQFVCRLKRPDAQGRRDILYSKLKTSGESIEDFVIEFLANNISTNARELEGYLRRLLAKKHFSGQEINLADLEEILNDHKKNSWVQPEIS